MAAMNRSTVVGVFTDRLQAEQAIQALERAGFTDQQIGFIRRGEQATGEARADTGTKVAAGVGGGGVIRGLLGAGEALLIPGFGPAIAGGILESMLGGALIGAATGGILGALTNMGVPEEEARYYQKEVEAGHVLVTVKTDQRQQEVMNILRQYGAYDASTRA